MWSGTLAPGYQNKPQRLKICHSWLFAGKLGKMHINTHFWHLLYSNVVNYARHWTYPHRISFCILHRLASPSQLTSDRCEQNTHQQSCIGQERQKIRKLPKGQTLRFHLQRLSHLFWAVDHGVWRRVRLFQLLETKHEVNAITMGVYMCTVVCWGACSSTLQSNVQHF